MQCQHANDLFSDYLAGDIDRPLSVSLENHLATCTHCSEELAALQRVWESLTEMPAMEPPLYFHENIMSRLDAEYAKQEEAVAKKRALWDWRSLFRPRSLAFAATALVFLFAGAHLTQRAELDPLEGLIHLFRPASMVALQTSRIAWIPNMHGGGNLELHLRAANAEGHTNVVAYQVTLPGHKSPDVTGEVTSERETVVVVPVAEIGSGIPTTLTVQLSAPGDMEPLHQKSVTVPITTAPSAP